MGDFNEVISQADKRGGRKVRDRGPHSVSNLINACELIDLGFMGPSFTWTNSREREKNIMERLDRVWSNREWQLIFTDAQVQHLPKTHSNHHPLNLILEETKFKKKEVQGRFQLAWATHQDFRRLVEDTWNKSMSMQLNLGNLMIKAKEWNRNVFGNIFQRKERCLARINGTQLALSYNASRYLKKLEDDLLTEYNQILEQEELHWFQKAKVDWLKNGERNTCYFHLTAIIRKRRGTINMLKSVEQGAWIENQETLSNMAANYYKDLYNAEDTVVMPGHIPNFPTIYRREREPCLTGNLLIGKSERLFFR